MNFFGHAWVAAWFSDSEPFLLGSMLPDLANALRTRVPSSSHADLSAGIRLHHATDRVFHATEAFQALEQRARLALSAAGLSKGPRRALAHIGVEFLIDDDLARRDTAALDATAVNATARTVSARYAAALRFGASPACHPLLHWSNTSDVERFGHLCRRLGSVVRAVPAPSRLDEQKLADRQLAARLIACLAGRPRLELQPHEQAALEPWLATCRPAVAAATPSLLDELARALEAPSPAPAAPARHQAAE